MRDFIFGSLSTLERLPASTEFWKLTAVWSGPVSAMRALVESSNCWLNVTLNWSTYWCRSGSVFGSQLGFLTSTIDLPDLNDWILYGPLATGFLSYFSLVSPFWETSE